MPTAGVREAARRWGPEALLALLAGVVFLGCLGAVDLWGKREQRASAEAIDTIDRGHWLVARIQCRPRLEKPPLPRWTIAALMRWTGRRDEWMVRLPSALSALGTVALVSLLGRRLGDRSTGLAAGLALTSTAFFMTEMRQAGNDGPLTFFTTLALYAAWRRLHAEGSAVGAHPGSGRWNLLLYLALGLGFLCKGPVILLLVGLTVVLYLALARKLVPGLRFLLDGWGLLAFALLALSWPLPVLLSDPNAARVWLLEMGQKAGTAGIVHRNHRLPLAADWSWMTLPWVIVATSAVLTPLLPYGRAFRPRVWFPWCWAVGNLAMFCLWSVAKPNYYLPCLPGAALLVGLEWVRLTRLARDTAERLSPWAQRLLQFHWVALFVGAVVAPVVTHHLAPRYWGWSVAVGSALAVAVVLSAWLWRRGADAGALAPLVGAWAVGVLIAYGAIAPAVNPARSHRALAATLDRLLPPDAHTVMFFKELDEGLWFYLRDRALEPVPGTQPRYNMALDLVDDQRAHRFEPDPARRIEHNRQTLRKWIDAPDRASSYVLIQGKDYDLFAAGLADRVTPVLREHGLSRNELVLLRVNDAPTVAAGIAVNRK